MNFHVIMTCSDLVIPRVIEYSSTTELPFTYNHTYTPHGVQAHYYSSMQ